MQSKEGKSQGRITGEKGKLVGKWRTERLRKWKGKGWSKATNKGCWDQMSRAPLHVPTDSDQEPEKALMIQVRKKQISLFTKRGMNLHMGPGKYSPGNNEKMQEPTCSHEGFNECTQF